MQSNKDKFLQLINRFFSGKTSSEEIKHLVNFFFSHQKITGWPKNFESKKTVETRIYDNIQSNLNIGNDTGKQPIPLYKRNFIKYAAAIVIFVSIGYFTYLNNSGNSSGNTITVDNNIRVGTDKATLTLEDGSVVALEKGQNYVADNLTSNGEEIVYNNTTTTKPEIAYNYLTIPRGGQYHVVLSDGTEVWLNSESQLKYPVAFADAQTRKVELVYGEAYFEVSHSTKHRGSRFKVFTKNQEIEVLGTEFNISAYKDENAIYTTLVGGKIAVANGEFNTVLNPNQQSIVKGILEEIYVVEADVFTAISWREGIFSFENMSLEMIMKVLSRWYDFEVEFSNPKIKEDNFTGVLRKNQNIEEILNIIKTINDITYEINNKTIILK